MSNQEITILIAVGCGVLALAAWVALFVVPAWHAYSRMWERFAAMFLTLYVLAALVVVGVGAGVAVAFYWDRIAG